MSHLELAFDGVLAAGLVGSAAAIVWVRETFTATALFIVFGILMAVAWARLGAVDLALAEAAIGAGITGALLLHAQGAEAASSRLVPASIEVSRPRRRDGVLIAAAVATAAAGLLIALGLLEAPVEMIGLGPGIEARLEEAGAENPVTAVLLNVRAYDTLLEIVVLLAAVVAAWALALPKPPAPPSPGLLLVSMTRAVAPVTVLIGGYLLWRGTMAPGGAFQGGAVIAGAGILAALAAFELPRRGVSLPLRIGLASGTLVFLAAGAYGPALGEPFLTYREGAAARWIVVVEVAATISIALALVSVFIGRSPEAEARGEGDRAGRSPGRTG